MWTNRTKTIVTLAALAALSLFGGRADAGCGCAKPPPPVANVRPSFASPGAPITLFNPSLVDGASYRVKFRSGTTDAAVMGIAQVKRDFADGQKKVQLVVAAPALPPGPTRIVVQQYSLAGWRNVSVVTEDQFTTLQRALPLAEIDGEIRATCYSAAVGTDGTVYIPVDISSVTQRLIFAGFAENYPLLFDASGIAIYNTQGVLMQLLGPDNTEIYAISDPGQPHSFELSYDRHEFLTYKLEHVHEGQLALDPTDSAWHMDGTRHVDHNQLVVAIRGEVEGQGVPIAGVTPSFNLHIATAHPDSDAVLPTVTVAWSTTCSSSNSGSGSTSSGSGTSGSGTSGGGTSGTSN